MVSLVAISRNTTSLFNIHQKNFVTNHGIRSIQFRKPTNQISRCVQDIKYDWTILTSAIKVVTPAHGYERKPATRYLASHVRSRFSGFVLKLETLFLYNLKNFTIYLIDKYGLHQHVDKFNPTRMCAVLSRFHTYIVHTLLQL